MNEAKCKHCDGTGLEQDSVAIGKTMREAREKSGQSGRETAKRMGISAAYLSDLELGRRHWGTKQLEAFRIAIKNPYAGAKL